MGYRHFLLGTGRLLGTFKRVYSTSRAMEIRFDGKRALVTGAGKGIGRAVTLKLAELGADVIAVSRTQADLDALQKQSPKIHGLCLDVGKWNKTTAALKNIGHVDLLVNNAAIMDVKEIGDLTEEEVDRTLNINVKGMINVTQLISNGMKASGKGGAIVNLSSCLGLYGVPHYSVYCGSKGAVHMFTRSLATELGPHKIRINSVNPTVVRTRMTEKEGLWDDSNQFAKMMTNRTPLRRFAEPEDVVGPIMFLLSDYASMITGTAVPIDGGLSVSFA